MLRIITLIWIVFSVNAQAQDYVRSHAIAMHGAPQYSADFEHFAYVNPNAPKQGDVTFASIGTFDTFNGFVVKGTPAAGVGLVYDSLMTSNSDEPFTYYGLLAQTIDLANDNTWVRFNLHPDAKFQDGMPVTAQDVEFSFNTLLENGTPFYRSYYGGISSIEVESDRSIRFNFENGDNRELPLILGQLLILPKHFWQERDFTKADLTIPMGSGAYTLKSFDAGRSVTYELDPNYWGAKLPVNLGQNNIKTLNYEYYLDSSVALEAFKAGRIDFRLENSSKNWATAYTGPQFEDGRVIREEIANLNPQGMQGYVFNTRKDKFSDIRVREAISLLFDFEWTNDQLFYGAYKRTNSFFAASELASSGLPEGRELKLLEAYQDQLPEQLFTQPFEVNRTSGDGTIRKEMREALRLFKEAGWALDKGKLLNAEGEQFEIEFLIRDKSSERIVLPFTRNLQKVGIKTEVRLVDISQFINRIQSYDFDMMTYVFAQSNSPGNEQREFWGSLVADKPGSRNLIGIKSPVVDALIEELIHSDDREQLVQATRALDRVLLWGHYVVPQFHLNTWRVAYWGKLKRPENSAKYNIELNSWWVE
ncbi:ABC transporter substrate-binding protein [Alginatibacterium sediminis]|uniref:ABC transporter substrate-binding protein n=1 Tax=Alginatibacterium sediminis TaxID=2164068 RepID=A0A420ED90_9ALTE|nr:extracellular solute-binding protein [Alginatibacterium sediminis]RKF18631.1 ABC transporter substrate-binding protein [Alginatibacterium sediminis]